MNRRWQTLLGVAITVALLWWVLRDVPLSEVWDYARAADPGWLLAAVVTATLSFVPRAMRWHVLLLPVHDHTRFTTRFEAVCIGAMANNVLPVRLGEFARAYSFSRMEPVGAGAAFGSLVVERIFDGLVLAGLLAATLALPGSPVTGDGSDAVMVRRVAGGAALLFGAVAVAVWLLARYPEKLLRLFERTVGRVLPPDLTDRSVGVLASFVEGLGALHRPLVFLRIVLWTLAVWVVSGLSLWFGLLAFDISAPGVIGGVFLQALIGFAVAIPSSPGFFGPFEAAARVGLGFYGVGSAQAVSFAGVIHIATFIPVTLLGLWFMHRLGLRLRELERSEEIVGAAMDTTPAGAGGAGGDAEAPPPRSRAAGDTASRGGDGASPVGGTRESPEGGRPPGETRDE